MAALLDDAGLSALRLRAQAGMSDYLSKPIERDALIRMVQDATASRYS